ncbi:MAG: sugar ABC transporter permease [Natronomonas sp.]|jgi:ABC-type sugar transport system permease subunit|uniref:carbohydrate ABC transporter permease n=1 Tax=Natronomonas sp. TaxID=2184060 RepID=UPI0028700ABB|nr:sugar ABC transporter permease [Natronomonas sp.]MDR9431865.1 sugar ABC transporter permease [Natronomonas sp.]
MGSELRTDQIQIDRSEQYRETLKEHWFSLLLVLPILLLIIAVLWLPFLRGVWISLHHWTSAGKQSWVGLGNFQYLWQWEAFWVGLRATVVYGMSTVIQLVLALAAAMLLWNMERFKGILSGIFLLPYTMPQVVTGTIWMFLLEPNFGPVFTILVEHGVLEKAIAWPSQGNAALAVVTLVAGWTFWPFMFLIFIATLESLPEEYYEAARIYGANRWQSFVRITLPQLKSAILVAVSLRVIWNFSKVAQPLQMTGGGPGFDTSLLPILMYRIAFSNFRLGRAYAVGIVLLLLVIGFAFLFIREFERQSGDIQL